MDDKEKTKEIEWRRGVIDRRRDYAVSWVNLRDWAVDLFDFRIKAEHRRAGIKGDGDVWDLLGKVLWLCFVLMVITGVFMLADYRPVPSGAAISVEYIRNEMSMGWLLYGLHRYASDLFVILLIARLARMAYRRAYRGTGYRNWFWAVIIFVLTVLTCFSGAGMAGYEQLTIQGLLVWHLGFAMSIGIFTIAGIMSALTGPSRWLKIDLKIPWALAAGVSFGLVLLVMAVPPNPMLSYSASGGDIGTSILLFLIGLSLTIGLVPAVLLSLVLFVVSALLPFLDMYPDKGPRPAITAVVAAMLITMGFIISSHGFMDTYFIGKQMIMLSCIWLVALIFGIAGEVYRTKLTEARAGDN